MPAEPRRASTNRFASTAANGAQRAPAAPVGPVEPVEPESEAAPVEHAEPPRRRRAPAKGTRTSLYLPPDVSAQLLATVDDMHYRLRVAKGEIYGAIVAAGMTDMDAIERQVTSR